MKITELIVVYLFFLCTCSFSQVVIDHSSEIDHSQMPQAQPTKKSVFGNSEFRVLHHEDGAMFSFLRNGETASEIVLNPNLQAYNLLWDDHGMPWFILCRIDQSSKEVIALVTIKKRNEIEEFQFFSPTVVFSKQIGYVNNLLLIRGKDLKIASIFYDRIGKQMRFRIGSIKISNLKEITDMTKDQILK